MRIITKIGGTLFEVAAAELGSALQWINIARANGMSDPLITGQVELIIPAYSVIFSDGIGPQ